MDGLANRFEKSASKIAFAQSYFQYLHELMEQLDTHAIAQMIECFEKAGHGNARIYFIGNGGSASIASHFANDLGYGIRSKGHLPLKVQSLTDNISITTALANDRGYDAIFKVQLENILNPEDLVVALSVSGNSPNIVQAVEYAQQVGVTVIGFTGFDGGKLRELADIKIHIPTPQGEYGPVEDLFMMLDHLIYSYFKLSRHGSLISPKT